MTTLRRQSADRTVGPAVMALALTVWLLATGAVRAAESPLVVPPAVVEDEQQRIAVMERASIAVLAIFPATGEGGGSGVVISPDGFALTNFHVAQPCGHAMKCGMADGRVYDAVLVGLDPTGDVALIKLFGRDDFPVAEIGDSDQVRVGDHCFAMGNPFMLAADFRPTATWGIISGTRRYQYPAGTLLEYTDCLQTDASINPGNSGGPLFDEQGRLIGINGRASFEKRGRVNVGIAYAISINQVKNFLGHLRSGRIVDHATLGATIASDAEGKPVVSQVLEQADAYRRGLRYDDEIVSIAGRPVATANAVKNVLGIYPCGWRIPLVYRRDGVEQEILVRLRGAHNRDQLIDLLQQGPRSRRIAPPDDVPPHRDGPPDERPDEEPEGDDDAPLEEILPHAAKAPPMPEIVEKHFQQRRGYANYFFNEQEQQRVLQDWPRARELGKERPVWVAEGSVLTGDQFRLTIDEGGCRLALPRTQLTWDAEAGWVDNLSPPQSGGLFPALYLWRKLTVDGPASVDRCYYLGKAPLAGGTGWDPEELADVLVARHRGVEAHFYFQPSDGRLLAVELFGGGEDRDPCEVYLQEPQTSDIEGLPGVLAVRCGDAPYATFRVNEWGLEPAAKEHSRPTAPATQP